MHTTCCTTTCRAHDSSIDHLVGHGHRRIACVTGPLDQTSGHERLQGYREALLSHAVPIDESLVRVADWEEITGGLGATKDLFASGRDRPTAVYYANSQLLLGGYKAFHGLGLSVPKDVAAVSFDPPYVLDALVPIPTTLAPFEEKIGLTAAKILHGLMVDLNTGGKEIRIRCVLRCGASCGCT